MLSYFIVIIRPKKLGIDCTHMKRLNDMKTYRWTQKQKKNLKKTTLSLLNAGPQNRVLILSTKCEGCHPKGLIVASSYKIKQIITAILALMRQS